MRNLIIFLALFGFLGTGCTGPEMLIGPVVNGIIIWKQGEAQKYYDYDSKILYKATIKTLKELKMPYEVTVKSETEFHIIADANRRFNIKISNVNNEISLIKMRIGFLGDKPYAELIYKKIDENIPRIEFETSKTPARKLFPNRKTGIR